MRTNDFVARFGADRRPISDVLASWRLGTLSQPGATPLGGDESLVSHAVVVGDALHGDAMLDQIPRELRDALENLMRVQAGNYNEMRSILRNTISGSDGFREFTDNRVQGFISKIKGQIGENIFREHAGTAAQLAQSGSQEAWDVAVGHSDGIFQYVQVKLYGNPRDVIKHMLEVAQKVSNNSILGCAGDVVEHIDFAVPADIAEQVVKLKDRYEQLEAIRVLPIPISADGAAKFVEDGLANVGPNELGHFFDELLGGAIAAGALHALVNGFLWYKGVKTAGEALGATVTSTSLSTSAVGLALLAETFCHAAMLSGAVGITSRILLTRMARSRWTFAEFLERSIAETQATVLDLRRLNLAT